MKAKQKSRNKDSNPHSGCLNNFSSKVFAADIIAFDGFGLAMISVMINLPKFFIYEYVNLLT